MGATFLVCHGAWSAGWAWKKMHPLMAARGHRLVTPTYTGLGERAHLANPSIDLETHIQDILNVIKYEDLRDIVLVGHSYGGMVATGVADRARDRIAQLIYLDAFVPDDGQSLLDLNEPARPQMQQLAKSGDGWRVPPNPTPPDTPPADLEWLTERRVDMPIKCFEMPAQAAGRRADLAAQLYLRHAHRARGHVRSVCQTREERGRLALLRDRRQPFAQRHGAGSADGVAAEDRHGAGLKLARGPACYAEPLILSKTRFLRKRFRRKHQPACKPGSVGHHPLARTIRDGHSSGTTFARCLEQPTRTASLTSPCGVIASRRTSRLAVPIRFCSRCGLPCRFRCRTRGALLPHLFTLARRSPEGRRRAVRSLWHCPWGRPRRMLSGTVCRWSPDFPLQPPFDACRSGRPAD